MFTNLTAYGFTQPEFSVVENLVSSHPQENLAPGRIIEARRELFRVVCEEGEVNAELKGSFYYTLKEEGEFPVVGDFVLVKQNQGGNALISAILPRRSRFSRANLSGHAEGYAKYIKEEVAASNFDYVFILSSLNYDFNLGRIARYLTATWRSGGFPVILLTKADLCADPGAKAAEVRKIAKEVPVIPISSKTGSGMEELEPFLRPGKTVVFLGSSGVGKSSLLNFLAGENIMEVKEIREDDSKGRHTTTHRQLCRLASGALIIDTPGMRELALFDVREGMGLAFAEVEELIAQCKFSNCAHSGEPGCAVQAALDEGRLSPEMWRNYRIQQREAAYVEKKSVYLQNKRARHKAIAKNNRNLRKH